jgi:hypothetical protein
MDEYLSLMTISGTPHAYIQVQNSPAPSAAISLFQSLMYFKPDPWQPSPVIFALGQSLDTASPVLREWRTLAEGARRNVPFLVVGPEAQNGDGIENVALAWMEEVRREKMELLELRNLTMGTSDGRQSERGQGMEMALVEAMMVMNWLSKLRTP